MYDDAAALYQLVMAIVIPHSLNATAVFRPDLDAEGVRVTIRSPDHEFIVALSIDSTFSLKLGVGTPLVDHQPLIVTCPPKTDPVLVLDWRLMEMPPF